MRVLTHASPRCGLAFLSLLGLLLLSGCAGTPQTRALTQSPPPQLADRIELTQTPFFPQEQYQCGPAALATVLNHQGYRVSDTALVDEIYVPARQGSLQTEILAAVRSRDLMAYVLEPQLESLLKEVASGRPVLVMQNLGVSLFPVWHYAVVIGYDLPEQRIILRSGLNERHINSFKTFERTWRRANRWAIIITDPNEINASAQVLPWLRTASGLEQTGRLKAATSAYQSAMHRWPEQPIAWIGLANTQVAAGDTQAAEAALRDLVAQHPHNAPGWNNLANVLLLHGCAMPALNAAQCAIRLQPEHPSFQETLRAVSRQPEMSEPEHCSATPPCPLR
ncbi:PA2778 family cysteine peptidase [Ectothiorhodosinus mongolicus]|uniref:PA2778 family cysteine peptidase n=1 Tax=Ectothiorhodosinus mongolicus TaxID=233100 RepID=UPI001F3F1E59|nr:PA2778 family cysteine peptidase [Ectothiorhodosinus mongolicus]